MNYYERYCGDYGRDTSHLSLTEHGAYALMLDAYYSTEKPLPSANTALYRICHAITKAERGAVEAVAAKFFPVGEDGFRHNKRADREIPGALERIATARINGRKGGRPPKNPAGSKNKTQEKPSGLADGNPAGTPAAKLPSTSTKGFSTQTVENQEGANAPLSGKPDAKAQTASKRTAEAKAILAFLNERAGRNFPPTDTNVGIIVARMKEGFTAVQIRQVVASRIRHWKGNDKMEEYLRPETLFNRTKFSSYVGELVDIPDDEAVA